MALGPKEIVREMEYIVEKAKEIEGEDLFVTFTRNDLKRISGNLRISGTKEYAIAEELKRNSINYRHNKGTFIIRSRNEGAILSCGEAIQMQKEQEDDENE